MKPRRVYIETYGCQMNEYDSSMISSMLTGAGYALTEGPEEADVVIVNTCSVRERAEVRVLGRLRHLRGLAPPDAVLGAVGCVAQRMGDELFSAVRGLDFVVGTDSYALLPDVIEQARDGATTARTDINADENYASRPAPSSAGLRDFVSVMRGCNNFCSYCIVPYVRGRERSLPAGEVVDEVRTLVGHGMRDVTLLGQNVNSYDDGGLDFAGLLERVDGVAGLERIRFATSHPKDLSPRLIRAVAELEKVCEHVHLPVQSGSDAVLERMNRRYTRRDYVQLIAALREEVPGVAITTDVIAGFPGETREDHERTLALMRRVRFDSAFMFRYSVRTGTQAAGFDDDVPEHEKITRLKEIITLQQSITTEINAGFIGDTVEVLVEGPSQRDPTRLFGRTRTGKAVVLTRVDALVDASVDGAADALVDASVDGAEPAPGTLVESVVTGSSAWTLHAALPVAEKDLAGPSDGC